jgi:RNA polymerase sigma-70 factor, ECF subfamily
MFGNRVPDEQIVGKVLNGDRESFRDIVTAYQTAIFNIGMRFFRNRDDALDFLQEVFLKAYKEIRSYKRKAPFRAWLTRIAYNAGINKIKELKTENIQFSDDISSRVNTENDYIRDETVKVLVEAVNSLPDQYRICIDLYFFMGLKYADIESITGYPVNTIKSNVLRAKRILRDKLRGNIAEDYHEM